MTPAQNAHLKRILSAATERITVKYTKGAEEHGGNLWDNEGIIDEAIDEVADLLTYLCTLKEQIDGPPADKYGGVPRNPGFTPRLVPDAVLVKGMDPEGVLDILPPQRPTDVGYDLVVSQETHLPPFGSAGGGATTVPSAVKMKIPTGYYAQIVGRSSAANKRGVLVHTATIDPGYTGQLFACCWNMTNEVKLIKKGERLAQVVFLPTHTPPLEEVIKLPITERGEDGFGSTGL